MKAEYKKEILFIIYTVTVLILAAIYFTVPERKDFIEFQFKWWRELVDVIAFF